VLLLWLISDSPYKFTVQFRQAENYPVDLYYVMDMSHSMNDDKERLALLGELLGECNCYRLILIIAMVCTGYLVPVGQISHHFSTSG